MADWRVLQFGEDSTIEDILGARNSMSTEVSVDCAIQKDTKQFLEIMKPMNRLCDYSPIMTSSKRQRKLNNKPRSKKYVAVWMDLASESTKLMFFHLKI